MSFPENLFLPALRTIWGPPELLEEALEPGSEIWVVFHLRRDDGSEPRVGSQVHVSHLPHLGHRKAPCRQISNVGTYLNEE